MMTHKEHHEDPLFIGLDIGTSQAKAVLISATGDVIARSAYTYRHLMASPIGLEQDAEDWWQAACHLANDLVARKPAGTRIRALACSTQGGSLVPTDSAGLPLRPAIIWSDQRGEPQREKVLQRLGADYIYRKTGWTLGRGLNLLQLLHLETTEPEIFYQARYYLSVPDFLSLRLTGRPAVDCSNGGINQLMDIERKQWDANILEMIGIMPGQLADIVESGQVVGMLLPAAAQALGVPDDTLLVSGGHDQLCAALGAGAIHASDRLIGTGTAWVLMEIQDRMPLDLKNLKAFSRHPVEGLWSSMISLSSGGASLEWARTVLNLVEGQTSERLSLAALDQRVAERLSGLKRPFFFPYLNGCSYPARQGSLRAMFFGLSAEHDSIDMAAAVMEGVAMQTAWMWDAYPQQDWQTPIIMTGGAGRSAVWRQILADSLNRPLQTLKETEIGCAGAAVLAGLGSGYIRDLETATRKVSQPDRTTQPHPANEDRRKRAALFRQIQQAVAQIPL